MGEKFLEELVGRIDREINKLQKTYEIILINDGSPDNSAELIKSICQQNKAVKGLLLSRNFGQHYAIHAGLKQASGKWITVMDCDLQNRPEEISRLYQKAQEGYKIVLAQRLIRKDTFFKKISSKIFYAVLSYMTDSKQDASIGNFGMYHYQVIEAILSMKDHLRYFPTMVQWVGFSKTKIPVAHSSRNEGKSSYTLDKLLSLAADNIIAFSNKPLRLVVKFGLLISLASTLVALYYLYKFFMGQIIVLGYASLIISVWFLSGIIIFTLGISGIYIGKVFEKIKERPLYIIDEKINCHDHI